MLFGGQEFVTFEFHITDQMKDDLIKEMAKYWACVKTNTLPDAQTIEQTKLIFPVGHDGAITATREIESAIAQLKDIKGQIKAWEVAEEQLEVSLRNALGERDTIVGVDGSTLVTWRNSKPSKRFSSTLFQQAMPDIYEQFVIEQPGSRRFLVK